jgi:hypothetical protein
MGELYTSGAQTTLTETPKHRSTEAVFYAEKSFLCFRVSVVPYLFYSVKVRAGSTREARRAGT